MIYNYSKFIVSENVKYHLDNQIPLTETIFRPESKSFYSLLKEARTLFEKNFKFSDHDQALFENTDIGKFKMYNNILVPLDLPLEEIILEKKYKGKDVKLNYPRRNTGNGKKYYVYVYDKDKDKVIKINFGDSKGGLTAKVSDPEARKRFSSRHNCDMKKDKLKAGYWACRINRYGHLWNGKTYPGYW